MKYVHHADYTCLSQAHAFNAGHQQIERYTFPFTAPSSELEKDAVLKAIGAALESRAKRRISSGRMHVELDEDTKFSGRVVDHIPRDATGNLLDNVAPVSTVSTPTAQPTGDVVIPFAVPKEDLEFVFAARENANSNPFEVNGETFEPGTITFVNCEATLIDGLYRGNLLFKRSVAGDTNEFFDFNDMPGIELPPAEDVDIQDETLPPAAEKSPPTWSLRNNPESRLVPAADATHKVPAAPDDTSDEPVSEDTDV